jgi:hypothetical protein
MELADLSKDVRRFLLQHWTKVEIESRLSDPEYFFEQVVLPRLDYLRRQNEDTPRLRLQRTPQGELRVLLL